MRPASRLAGIPLIVPLRRDTGPLPMPNAEALRDLPIADGLDAARLVALGLGPHPVYAANDDAHRPHRRSPSPLGGEATP